MGAKIKAYAKINLTLNVTGAANGFHTVESLAASIDLYDIIKLKKRKDGKINIVMRGRGTELLPPENNNAYKAALAYQKAFETGGADIKIYKNIPVGAGLGGSSADAAGVIRGMCSLYGAGTEPQLKAIADGLGSDTGYMLTGGYAYLTGRGEIMRAIKCPNTLYGLLLIPDGGVSTARCYALFDEMCAFTKGGAGERELVSGDLKGLGRALCNDLFKPAAALNKGVATAYEELKSFAPLGVNMTGSGSGVYALFESRELCAYARSRYSGECECIQFKTVL